MKTMVTLNTRNGSMRWDKLSVATALGAALAAFVANADAQITNPVSQGASAPTAVAAPPAPAPSPAAPTAQAPRPMLYYVCGNAGIDTQMTSPDPRHPFNLGVSFVSANAASPPSDVAVKVRRHGRVLMEFVAAGPHCLFSVPDGEYRVEGTAHGDMKFEIVQTGNLNAQIKW
ncbi:hypothetical protein [Burkholderia perseverans]|uniref:hypothetical protein n=1 Tax=Burkholderia perseverans TaxID=2615214 RepID=UPI001FEE7E29|nr:hypothetical protein [Burkholderia perseverans]